MIRRSPLKRQTIDPRFVFDRSRYPVEYLDREWSEAIVQKDILRELHRVGIAAFAFDSGGKAMRARAGAGGAAVGAAGLPDVIGWLPGGKGLFIEVKRPALIIDGRIIKRAGMVSDEQAAFLTRAHAAGCAAGVAWSAWDALLIAGVE